MTAKTVNKLFEVFLGVFALSGVGGLLVVTLIVGLGALKMLTGIDLVPDRPGGHVTLGGILIILAMSLFWLFEIVACWLFRRRYSKRAIYVAVGLLGFWSVCITDIIVFEVFGTGEPESLAHLPLDLMTLAVICWPCIALARWLARETAAPPIIKKAEPPLSP
jgi:hypothetical protein